MRSTAAATSLAIVALASSSANAFVPIAHPVTANAPLHMSSVSSNYLDSISADDSENDTTPPPNVPVTAMESSTTAATTESAQKMAKKPMAKKKKAAGGPAHKAGVFSPIVYAGKMVLGDEQLNKLRAKIISLHSNLIKDFVSTHDSAFGQAVLRSLFEISDLDKDGKLSRDEVASALRSLGFEWLKDKQIDGIIKRADTDENGYICIDEFCVEAPRTLSTNLVKLAKKNGGDMGLLV